MRRQLLDIPVEVRELFPPYIGTKLTGTGKATDERAMPLGAYLAEVVRMLAAKDHSQGELLLVIELSPVLGIYGSGMIVGLPCQALIPAVRTRVGEQVARDMFAL